MTTDILDILNPAFDRKSASFDELYDALVDALGGTETVREFVPFDDKTLETSYAHDKNFNDSSTPIRAWDAAAGFTTDPNRHDPTGRGLWTLLLRHKITTIAPSQAVCILKRAAERHVLASRAGEEPTKEVT